VNDSVFSKVEGPVAIYDEYKIDPDGGFVHAGVAFNPGSLTG
jgi:hypothetical protein